MATRGCPSRCTFCVAKRLQEFNSKGRVRSADSLIRELKELKEKYFIDSFYFMDDLFTLNKDNVKRFCSLLKSEKMDLVWGCSSKVSTLNEEIIRVMAHAGCIQIDFGVERGSDNALRLMKKGQNIRMVKDIFSLCHKYGIRTFANMLVNLPGETESDLTDIVKLLNEIYSDVVSINIFTPYPGTEIYDQGKYKFQKEEYANLSKDITWLMEVSPDKFKYCSHTVNLASWVSRYSRKFNKILPNLKFYATRKYWNVLFKSKVKTNYFKQFNLLVKEFVNQKF